MLARHLELYSECGRLNHLLLTGIQLAIERRGFRDLNGTPRANYLPLR